MIITDLFDVNMTKGVLEYPMGPAMLKEPNILLKCSLKHKEVSSNKLFLSD